MFSFVGSVLSETTKIVEDVVDVGLAVVTLGEYGELSKKNVSRLIDSGLTIYDISEATGVAIDLIEKVLED
jgi:hypothetical protein